MIIKSKSYKSTKAFETVTAYVLREIEHEKSFVLTRFIKGNNKSVEYIKNQLAANESYRLHKRKNSVKLYMDILSFHKDDAHKLGNDKLKKIARKYISLRANCAIALATVHRDKSHVHLHILLSGVEYRTGNSIRVTRDEFKKVKQEIEAYQAKEYPELFKSAINHDKSLKKKS